MAVGCVVFATMVVGCGKESASSPGGQESSAEPVAATKATYVVTGMHCDGCANHIQKVVSGKPGVITCSVSFDTKRADVEYDGSKIDDAGILAAVVEAGYKAEVAPAGAAEPLPAPPAQTPAP